MKTVKDIDPRDMENHAGKPYPMVVGTNQFLANFKVVTKPKMTCFILLLCIICTNTVLWAQ